MGVVLKNENKIDEMAEVMTHLHQYVPTTTTSEERTISTGEITMEEKARVHPILLGGDQLTAARARGAKKSKHNAQTPSKRLVGLVPACEDWHAKANFLGVGFLSLMMACT